MSDRTSMEDVGYSEELSLFGKPQVDDFGDGGQRKFYGKYRATVVNNVDPQFRGRLLVQVVDVLGLFVSSWAMPCVPLSGQNAGQISIPPIGAGVWIEFEQGNPRKPIWVGGFWGTADAPVLAKALTPLNKPGIVTLFQTTTGDHVAIADPGMHPLLPGGGIILAAGPSVAITLDKTGIKMIAPSIMINGTTVINGGALVVT